MKVDLELVETSRLVRELKKRSTMMFFACKPKGVQDRTTWMRAVKTKSMYNLVGFVNYQLHDMMNDSNRVVREEVM